MQDATGATLPPEIIAQIVLQARPRDMINEGEKRGLTACSLVCRYWAGLLRRQFFHRLTLRTQEDFVFVLGMLNCPVNRPGPPLAQCMSDLRIVQFCDWTASSINLFHRMLQRLSRMVKVVVILEVKNCEVSTEPHVGNMGCTRDYLPFFALPRPLPGRLVPLTHLKITNVQMQRQTDIVRLLDSLPTVWGCSLTKVTFVERTSIQRRLLRRTSRLLSLRVCDCGDGSVEAQVQLASALIASQRHAQIDRDGAWGSILPVMLAWLPASSHYNKAEIKAGIGDLSYLSIGVYEGRMSVANAEAVFRFPADMLTDTVDFASNSVLFELKLDAGPHHREPARLHDFEEHFFQLPIIPKITIYGREHSVKPLLTAIFEGALSATIATPQFSLDEFCTKNCALRWHRFTRGALLSVPAAYTHRNHPMTLTPSQQADWLLRCTSQDQESYLLAQWNIAFDGNIALEEATEQETNEGGGHVTLVDSSMADDGAKDTVDGPESLQTKVTLTERPHTNGTASSGSDQEKIAAKRTEERNDSEDSEGLVRIETAGGVEKATPKAGGAHRTHMTNLDGAPFAQRTFIPFTSLFAPIFRSFADFL